MSEQDCLKCGERFFRGKSNRLVCGVCWPVDAANPIDWAKVPARARGRRSADDQGEIPLPTDHPDEAA